MLEITNVRVLKVDGRRGCVAIAKFCLSFDSTDTKGVSHTEKLSITGIKLYISEDGKKKIGYAKNPGSKINNFYVFPITKGLKSIISKALWEAYENCDKAVESEEKKAD